MKKYLITSLAGICLFVAPDLLNAQILVNSQVGGIPSVSGATLQNFDGTLPSILTLSGASQTSGSGATYAAPYFSGSTASYFGESPVTGADNTSFIAISGNGTATFNFSTPQNYFGILIGSLDSGDSLSFYDSSHTLIGTITGSNMVGNGDLGGDRGINGTVYVNINSTTPFSEVVVTTPVSSFEFDDVAYANVVPEPTSCAIAVAGLGIFGLLRRQKRV